MKNFVTKEIAVKLKELGYENKEPLAEWYRLIYFDENGRKYSCNMLAIPCHDNFDTVRMLHIDHEDGLFHWQEGGYYQGDHSRCELENSIPAPTWDEAIEFMRTKYIFINISNETLWFCEVFYNGECIFSSECNDRFECMSLCILRSLILFQNNFGIAN